MQNKTFHTFHTRRSERAPLKAAVSFRNREGEVSYGWSRDISLKGIYVHTDDRQRIGTMCELALTIKSGVGVTRLSVFGQVARYDAEGIAFQFCDLAADTAALIGDIVERHLEDEFGPPPEEGAEGDAPEGEAPAPEAADAPADPAPAGEPAA